MDSVIPWLRDVPPSDMKRIVDALYRVHRLLSAITDLNALLERIMEESKGVANAEACSLMLYDPESGELYFQVAQGETGDQQALKTEVRLKLDQGIAGAAATARQSINVPDVARDHRFYGAADAITQFKTRSLLAVPLVDRDALIGVVEVVNKVGGGAFTDTDLRVMEMFSSLAATAISNARLIEHNLRAERMAAIGQAVAGLSHYIKNILTGMTGSVDLVDRGLADKNFELLERCWPIFRRSAKRITIFVQDMLAFSKPRKPAYTLCDIETVVAEAKETFLGLQAQKNLSIVVTPADGKTTAYIDPEGIFSCVLNLLTNAGDAVAPNTGVIRISARMTPGESGKDLVIEVADNGPGVPEDQQRLIFEPFYSTKGSGGTGLGLPVTRKVVREHGGDIFVERAPEGGALFRMVIPGADKQREG